MSFYLHHIVQNCEQLIIVKIAFSKCHLWEFNYGLLYIKLEKQILDGNFVIGWDLRFSVIHYRAASKSDISEALVAVVE